MARHFAWRGIIAAAALSISRGAGAGPSYPLAADHEHRLLGLRRRRGYDAYGRPLARHIGKFPLGAPSVTVVHNLAAGGVMIINLMYNVARTMKRSPTLGSAPSSRCSSTV